MTTDAPVAPRRNRTDTVVETAALAVGLSALLSLRKRAPRAGEGDGRSATDSAGSPRRAAGERGRGREAETPAEIPSRGWFDVAKRVYASLDDDRLLAVAAGVTFYGLLAIFPAIGAFVSLYGIVADPATIADHLAELGTVMPGGALDVIGEQVKRITSNGGQTLGFALVSGLAISLWSANSGVKAVFDALNVAYGEREKRNFLWLNLTSLAFTAGAILFLIATLGAVVVIPVVLNFVGLGGVTEALVSLARWPLLLLFLVVALAVLYRFGPSREKPRWAWITPGAILASVGWIVFSMLFSWYVSKFGSYNATYGSLGAAIGFMTWMWLSATIVLVGAELNAETEHQTARDSTDGRPEMLGRRGAVMADRVGRAQS